MRRVGVSLESILELRGVLSIHHFSLPKSNTAETYPLCLRGALIGKTSFLSFRKREALLLQK